MAKRKTPKTANGKWLPMTHELIEKLYRTDLSAAELRVCLWIARHTYGQWDPIANGREEFTAAGANQISSETGLHRGTVYKILMRLIARGILMRDDAGRLGINEHWQEDCRQTATGPLSPNGESVSPNGESVSPNGDNSEPGKHGQSQVACAVAAAAQELLKREEREKKETKNAEPAAGADGGSPEGSRSDSAAPPDDGPSLPGSAGRLDALIADTTAKLGGAARSARRRAPRDPWRGVPMARRGDLQKAASAALSRLANIYPDLGSWWGKSLNQDRWAPGMLAALHALERAVATGDQPDKHWAWLTRVADAEEGRIGAEMVEARVAEEKKTDGREDAGLRARDAIGTLAGDA